MDVRRLHKLNAKGWLYTPWGPVQVQVVDFHVNNSGRINHHVKGGLPLYWLRPVKNAQKRVTKFVCGHSYYGDEIYPTKDKAYGVLI